MRPLPRFLVVALAASGFVLPAGAQTEEPWPMVGGDQAHTGRGTGPAPPYRVAWRARVPELVAGPLVADGAVYALTEEALVRSVVGSGRFGEVARRAPGPAGSPAAEASVIEGQRTVAFPSDRGKEASVAFVGQTAAVSRFEFEGEDREPIGTFTIGAPAVGGITHVTRPGDGDLPWAFLVAARDGSLHALDEPFEDPSRVWRFKAAGVLEGAPAVSGDTAVVVAQNLTTGVATVHAVDVASGTQRWRYRPPGVAITASSATIAGETVVVGFGDARVRGLALDDGGLRWETRVRGGFSPRSVPIAPDDVYLGDVFGHVHALDPETGAERWVHRVPAALTHGSPVAAGNAVIVGDRSGQVSAIDTDSGHLVWRLDTGDRPVVGLAADGEHLYVSIFDDGVVALAHDPGGTLLDEPSPTTLFLGRALLNYAAAAVPLYLLLLLAFRIRRRRAERPDGWREP